MNDRRILVVDDEAELLEMGKSILGEQDLRKY